MLLENFTRFIKYYGKGRYFQLTAFLGLSFIAGILEFIGIALIYPFIIMIINPQNINSMPYYSQMMNYFHLNNTAYSAFIIGILVLMIFVAKNIFMIFTQYVQNKFVANWKKDITKKFMEYYIYAPYREIMKTSQADKLYVLNTLCNCSIDIFVMRGLNLMTNLIIIAIVITLLLFKFPIAAIITMAFSVFSMIIQNKYFKKRTSKLADNLAKEYKTYNESVIGNINNLKELKILSAEKLFFEDYAKKEKTFRDIQAIHSYYSLIPPYIVETIIVISLLILGAIISIQNFSNHTYLIASFAVVGAALFRIAPALNRVQSSIININSSREFVKKINEEYERCNFDNFKIYNSNPEKRMDFKNKIEIKNIDFSYNENKQIINNLSLEINKGDFIGIIGLSGAGKSTFADVLMGLLPPQTGEIFVDGNKLTAKNYTNFRNIIGYVPQEVNILDKSIKENVAWGQTIEKIDEEGVIKALKAAQIYNFVNEFIEGINSCPIIGSNGLSQGQKQRLAIARALYRDPEILIFDEATSALDVEVENEITEMLKQLSHSKTIIAIAHRLSTLKACNKLVYLKDGRIVDIGSFEELASRHPDFENLVKLSSIK